MAWPAALTVDADILKYVFEQGITRMLESGVDYTALHQGVATEVRLWLESKSIADADEVRNSSDFQPAASHLFVAKLLRSRNPELAETYNRKFLALMRSTRPETGNPDAGGGTVARIKVIKQGSSYYTTRRAGAKFNNFRSTTD